MYILDILLRIVLYEVSPILILRSCSSSQIHLAHFTSAWLEYAALQSFPAVTTDLVHRYEHIHQVRLQEEGLHHSNISIYGHVTSIRMSTAPSYSSLSVLRNFENHLCRMCLRRGDETATAGVCPAGEFYCCPNHVHYTTNGAERHHSKPPTQFNAVMLLSSYPAMTLSSFSSVGFHIGHTQARSPSTSSSTGVLYLY